MFEIGLVTNPGLLAGIRGIVFDCDGVIVNSYAANMQYYNWFRMKLGMSPMSREEEEYVHVHNVMESMVHVLGEERMDEALELRAKVDYRFVLPYVETEPGLEEFLLWLKSKGIRAGVNTNRSNTTSLLMDHLGLGHHFFPVVETARVANAKPHPEGVHFILSAWGLPRGDVVYIGDSFVDQHTAEAAGVRFWAYKNPSLRADAYVSDFLALKAAMGRAY